MFQRLGQDTAQKMQDKANRSRRARTFDPGEVVFRKMPGPARLPKRWFPDPCSGPYTVRSHPTSTSVILDDAEGKPVEGGRNIPLSQIVAGPRRAAIRFVEPQDGDCRALSHMLEGLAKAEPRKGRLLNRTTGWRSLSAGAHVASQTELHGPPAKELTVGRVLARDSALKAQRLVVVQPMQADWKGVRVVHRLAWQSRRGYSTDPAEGEPARETVRYDALVLEVELLGSGELALGSARELIDRSWGLRVHVEDGAEALRALIGVAGRGVPVPSAGSGPGGAGSSPSAAEPAASSALPVVALRGAPAAVQRPVGEPGAARVVLGLPRREVIAGGERRQVVFGHS